MSQPHHHHHHHHPRRTSASLIDSLARPTSAPLPPQSTIPTPRSPPSTNPSLPSRPSPLSRGARVAHRSLSSASDVIPSSSNLHGAAGRSALGGGQDAGKTRRKVLGVQERLRKEVDGVVKRRQGGVLARGFILKTDHYPTGRALHLDLEITGAPNFRAPDEEGLNVYGVAQPTVPGLKSILTILDCQPERLTPYSSRRPSVAAGTLLDGEMGAPLEKISSEPTHLTGKEDDRKEAEDGGAIWFSTREETLIYVFGRPFVLRDASNPFQTLTLSDRASNLEDIERRLKLDILDEARRYGGLLLFHDEVSPGTLMPTWLAVDEQSIRTPREVWEDVSDEGWRVKYFRIPIAPDRPIEDNYLDAYVSVLKNVDPLSTSLVFNCGMGVVRTTFGMVAALLVRRKQLLLRGLDDPFPPSGGSGFATPSIGAIGAVGTNQAAQFLEQATHQQALNKSLLRLTRVLDRNLPSKHSTAIDLLTSQPNLLEQLRKAHMGNYQIVLSLLSSLDNGRRMKRLVDEIIDCCDAVVNLRENVIEHRIKYSVSTMDDKARQVWLEKALRSLEQYFDLIVFAAYVEEEQAGLTGVTFSSWLKNRPEIWNQIKVMRRHGGNRLFAFAPVNDLSVISRSSDLAEGSSRGKIIDQRMRDVDIQGGKVLGDEWAEHVVQNRNGIMLRASTLLKSDLWLTLSAASAEGVRGAIGFRQISSASIFATGQPTEVGISSILRIVKERCPAVHNVIWVCLREEPLVMINGSPYCLRRDSTALRNMRDYTGVSTSRLEVLEERLKSDVISELGEFQGRVLLHTETAAGEVVPVWESVDKSDVATIRETMDDAAESSTEVDLRFLRIPITSESSPDFHDITELLDLCTHTDLETSAFILNDQLGRGRSSTTAVIVLLIQRWMKAGRDHMRDSHHLPTTPSRSKSRPGVSRRKTGAGGVGGAGRQSWQIINSCLRVIRNGLEVKTIVDEAIDATAEHFNLRDAIQDFRVKAEEAPDEESKHSYIEKGIYHLRRYFHLLLFQAYLDDTDPDEENPYSFESFVKHRPVFKTLETELEHGGLKGLTPIDRMEPALGMALPDEVSQVVANRSGAILSAQTILKSDFFSGLQKQSLPERVEGAANYRQVPLIAGGAGQTEENEHYVYGTGMPSGPGLRNALDKMGAGPNGTRKVMWTSLREEPVLYVKSRPHVLRLIDKPLNNVETTGVTAAVVERMETTLKQDVLAEIRAGNGRILLHDEVETKPGSYEIIPIWETVEEDEVMTPKEIYEGVIKEGYHVDYQRVAITDEQAPLPATLQTILRRLVRGLDEGDDFVFNCQMGRGRTTTGMIVASLVATIARSAKRQGQVQGQEHVHEMEREEEDLEEGEEDEGLGSEADQYLNGEYKTILQLVTVLSHGKQAKRLTDRTINQMEGVQNLRNAVYDFKIKIDAADPRSAKYKTLLHQGINYLYRYGAMIVLANFLLESVDQGTPLDKTDFPAWLQQHREIRSTLGRSTLD